MRGTSYWQLHRRNRCFDRFKAGFDCDVAVVGAGLTGLSIAFHLKECFPKWRVVVLEQDEIGSGASGRSGGIIVEDSDLAGSLADAKYLRRFISKYGINCDIDRRLESRDQSILNPFKLTLDLASLCATRRVEIYEHAGVDAIDHHDGLLFVGDLSVRAQRIFVATDGYAGLSDSMTVPSVQTSVQNCIAVRMNLVRSSLVPWVYFRRTDESSFVWGRSLSRKDFLFGDEERHLNDLSRPLELVTLELIAKLHGESEIFTSFELISTWSGLIGSIGDGGRKVLELCRTGRSFFVGGYNGFGVAAAVRSGFVATLIVKDKEPPPDFPILSVPRPLL